VSLFQNPADIPYVLFKDPTDETQFLRYFGFLNQFLQEILARTVLSLIHLAPKMSGQVISADDRNAQIEIFLRCFEISFWNKIL